MLDQFKKLNLKSGFVRELVVSPNRRLLVSLMVPTTTDSVTTGKTTRSYDVQFNKIADFKITVAAEPWLEVASHDALSSSPLIDRVLARRKRKSAAGSFAAGPLYHFSIVFAEGSIDVVAETCTVALVEELPAFSDDSR